MGLGWVLIFGAVFVGLIVFGIWEYENDWNEMYDSSNWDLTEDD